MASFETFREELDSLRKPNTSKGSEMNEAPFRLQDFVLGETREREPVTLQYVYVLGGCERKRK